MQLKDYTGHFVCFRFDGFEQGLNNFHIQSKILENARKSPPNKKTKKTNLDLVLDSPKKETKFGESGDKFMILGEF